jgi:Outer membrane protein beta-barrel domain
MRGQCKSAVVLALGLLFATPVAHAQGTGFSLGGGLGVPLGDFDDVAELGWHGTAAVTFVPSGWPVGIQVDGAYQQYSLEDGSFPIDGVKDQIIQGTANLVYTFNTSQESTFRPYLIGGGGVYNSKLTGADDPGDLLPDGETDFGVNAGAGFNFGAGSASLFIEGRFHSIFTEGSSTQFIPITLGIRFGGS